MKPFLYSSLLFGSMMLNGYAQAQPAVPQPMAGAGATPPSTAPATPPEFSPSAPPTTPPVVQTQSEGAAAQFYQDGQRESANPTALDYLFNRKPQDGTVGKQGQDIATRIQDKIKALDALNTPGFENRAVRARFAKFLGAKEVEPAVAERYLELYDTTLDLLADRKTAKAWQQLYALSEVEGLDHGISRELANRIETVWSADSRLARIVRENRKLRNNVDLANRSADMMAERLADKPNQKITLPSSVPKKPQKATIKASSVGVEGKLRLAEQYLQALEAKANIKLNEMKMEKLETRSKSDFADYISTLFASRRHYHVVLAAEFYRRIFDEGEYPVTMANQVNQSLNAINEIKQSVEVFRFHLGNEETSSATERLQEAFIVSEYHPSLYQISRTEKQQIAKFAKQMVLMQNLIEARDFGRLDQLLQDMQKAATDFDPAKPRALVDAVKLESKMRLGKAKLAAQKGMLEVALEEFRAAAEAWPANPDLEKAASGFFDSQDMVNQSESDFDRHYREKNYRKIFDEQLSYLAGVKNDPQRQEQLRHALETVKKAEMAIEKANLFILNGDSIGAWETVELAATDWPDDGKLNKMRANLAAKSAGFVSLLNRAQEAEERGDIGYSLTLFVNAQREYPGSQFANLAIKRLSTQLLQTTSAHADVR